MKKVIQYRKQNCRDNDSIQLSIQTFTFYLRETSSVRKMQGC